MAKWVNKLPRTPRVKERGLQRIDESGSMWRVKGPKRPKKRKKGAKKFHIFYTPHPHLRFRNKVEATTKVYSGYQFTWYRPADWKGRYGQKTYGYISSLGGFWRPLERASYIRDFTNPRHKGKYFSGRDMELFDAKTDWTPFPERSMLELHSVGLNAPWDDWVGVKFYIAKAPYQYDSRLSPDILQREAAGKGSEISGYGDISPYGTPAYNRFKPGKPGAGMGVFLGEFKDTIPMLQGTAKFFHDLWKSMGGGWAFGPKNLAQHWLNTQFGWKPFLNDIHDLAKSMSNMSQQLDNIAAHSNRWRHRKGTVLDTFLNETIFYDGTSHACYPKLMSAFYKDTHNLGTCSVTRQTSQRIWFSAYFKYVIEDLSLKTNAWWRYRIALKKLGIMPSPTMVWNLVPWSWLVDWVSSVPSGAMSSLDDGWAENLVSKNAFIMGYTEFWYTLRDRIILRSGDINPTWTSRVIWKQRSAASPFGFDLSSKDLSARQISILASLGLDKLL